jgi:Putative beta-barrel porin-2, OmpL-like. bbp2
MKKFFLFLLVIISFNNLFAQNDSTKKITYSAYGEYYYSYDFSEPSKHEKSNFLYNHKRHNEINANLLLVKASYVDKNKRANLALMTGNYVQYNLSAEPDWAQNISEANVGIKLSRKKNVWLDAGIFPSHLGSESVLSADCWTLTRSLAAENSPYYEAGLKMGYTSKNENLNINILLLNGWQKIQKPDYIQAPSAGLQVNYKPSKKLFLNYSNFIGTDKPDSINAIRTYHNIYAQYDVTQKIAILSSMDMGRDKYDDNNYGIWFSPCIIIKYAINEKSRIALRGEYFDDEKQVIIVTNTTNGFKTSGLSLNFDKQINNTMQWRIEGKLYQSKDEIFDKSKTNNFSITTNLSIKL